MNTNTNTNILSNEEIKAVGKEIIERIELEIFCHTHFNMSYKEWDLSILEKYKEKLYYDVEDKTDYSLLTPWLSYNRMTKKEKTDKSLKPLRYVSQERIVILNNLYNSMRENVVRNGVVIPNSKKVSLGNLLDKLENVILTVSQMNVELHHKGYVIQANSGDETYHIERNDGRYITCITQAMYDTYVSQKSIAFLKLKTNRKTFKLYHKPSPVILTDKELKKLEVSQKRALRDTKKIEKALALYNSYTFTRMTKVKSLEQFEEVVSHMKDEIQLEDDNETVLQQVSYSDSLTCDTLPMIYHSNDKTVIHEGVLHLIDTMADLNTVYDTVSQSSLKKSGITIARKGDTLIPIYTADRDTERELPEDESVIRVTLNGRTTEKTVKDYKLTNKKTKRHTKKVYDAASQWLIDNDPKRKTA